MNKRAAFSATIVRRLLVERRGLALLTALYFGAGLFLYYCNYALNNEGLLIHYTATWAWLDLPAIFFLQRGKPVISVLYALPAAAGVRWTMLSHLAVSTLGLPLIGEFARLLKYRLPNLPALILGLSPVFFMGGVAGIGNNDAIVGAVLTLWLLASGRSLAAGLVLGCLPWVRSELAPLVPILWLHAIWIEPNRRFAIGTAVFPVCYAIAGAVYHHDWLWMVHYPPSSPYNPNNPMWGNFPIGPGFFLAYLMTVTPIAAVVACAPWRSLGRLERTLLAYLVLMEILLDVFPIFKIGNFGGSPRYLEQLLPVLALLATRAFERIYERRAPQWAAVLAAVLLTAWSSTRVPGQTHALALISAVVLLLGLARLRQGSLALLGAVLLVLSGPILVPGTQIPRGDVAAYLQPMEDWLRTHADSVRGPVYTNSQLLHADTQLQRNLPPIDVHFLMGFDHIEGTLDLSNPFNGQRDAIRRLCEQSLYGRGVVASSLRPEDLPAGTIFLLRVEPRLNMTLPPEIWKERLQVLEERGGARIAKLLAR